MPKKFDPNDTLFQGFEMASDRLVNDVLKKLPATVAPLNAAPSMRHLPEQQCAAISCLPLELNRHWSRD
jgi:hypothetical protein